MSTVVTVRDAVVGRGACPGPNRWRSLDTRRAALAGSHLPAQALTGPASLSTGTRHIDLCLA
jgi:hypothetical protein